MSGAQGTQVLGAAVLDSIVGGLLPPLQCVLALRQTVRRGLPCEEPQAGLRGGLFRKAGWDRWSQPGGVSQYIIN